MMDRDCLSLPKDWEARLERRLIGGTLDDWEKVYICSPLRSGTIDGMIRNMRAAQVYMYYAYVHLAVIPKAPHAYLPVLLNDKNPDERGLALDFGLMLLTRCDVLHVCGDKVTDGMYSEITEAMRWGKPVQVWNCAVFAELNKKLAGDAFDTNAITNASAISDDSLHSPLTWGAATIDEYLRGRW